MEDCNYWNGARFRQYFADWLGMKHDNPLSSFSKTQRQFATLIKDKIKQKKTTRSTQAAWKPNQPVKHKTFGVGIVKKIEKRGDDIYFITAQFKMGLKKVKSNFLTMV